MLEYWELNQRQLGNMSGAETARALREQHGDIPLPSLYIDGRRSVNVDDLRDTFIPTILNRAGIPDSNITNLTADLLAEKLKLHFLPFDNGSAHWLSVQFGEPRKDRDGDSTGHSLYRAYLMVEPEGIAQAVNRLIEVAVNRVASGKRTEFKVLLGKGEQKPQKRRQYGNYHNLEIKDSIVVLYSEYSPDDLKEVLQALVNIGWEDFERQRILACGGIDNTPTRSFVTNEFVDANGKTWKSLNWNDFVGFAEDQETRVQYG